MQFINCANTRFQNININSDLHANITEESVRRIHDRPAVNLHRGKQPRSELTPRPTCSENVRLFEFNLDG